MTLANGRQIDTTTGLEYHEPGSILSMANGAYLDTKNNILTTADGTKIDLATYLLGPLNGDVRPVAEIRGQVVERQARLLACVKPPQPL